LAAGINDQGDIVGLVQGISPPGTQSFLYSGGVYSTITVPGAKHPIVTGINAAGSYTGYYFAGFGANPFVNVGGTFQALNPPGTAAGGTTAVAINNQGQVLLNALDNDGNSINFIYANGQYTLLTALIPANPFNSATLASGINNAGTIVGVTSNPSQVTSGFIFKDNTLTTIDDPNASNGTLGLGTIANAINDPGQVAGYYTDADFVPHGFVYQNGVFTTVDDPLGVGGTQIWGINDAGDLVGVYTDAAGNDFGFLATPNAPTTVPEPGSLTLLAAAGIALGCRRLRKSARWAADRSSAA
jgi:probable HAF family extracellular repeat protein